MSIAHGSSPRFVQQRFISNPARRSFLPARQACTLAALEIKRYSFTRKSTRVTIQIMLPVLILLLIVAGCLNFMSAATFASHAGLNFPQLISEWFKGIDVTREYPGVLVKATERWVTGLMNLSLAALFAVLLPVTLKRISREKRVLWLIEQQRNEQAHAEATSKPAAFQATASEAPDA